jgi:hypothetical protein
MNNAAINKYNNVAKKVLEKINQGKIISSIPLIGLLNLFVYRNSGPMRIVCDSQIQATSPIQFNILFIVRCLRCKQTIEISE